ncbi:hypothetical protein PENSPDRAFT_370651 [Peniophora sp. CONT]|nr:hypothetical protein PENSPDRAFT_370651 [Peniophora sp. CONT]
MTSPYHSYGCGGPTRSPHSYSREPVSAPQRERERDHERDVDWQQRDWEHRRDMRAGPGPEYMPQQPPYHYARYERSPPGGSARCIRRMVVRQCRLSPRASIRACTGVSRYKSTRRRRYENRPPPKEYASAQCDPPPSSPSRTSESPHVVHRSRRRMFSKDEPSPAEMQPPQQLAGSAVPWVFWRMSRRSTGVLRRVAARTTPVPTPYPPQQQGSYRGSYKDREIIEAARTRAGSPTRASWRLMHRGASSTRTTTKASRRRSSTWLPSAATVLSPRRRPMSRRRATVKRRHLLR